MRKIKLYIASSLDSFIADENGSIDWLFSDADYGYTEYYNSVDTILVGRKTYEQSLTFEEYPYKGKKVSFLLIMLRNRMRKRLLTLSISIKTYQNSSGV